MRWCDARAFPRSRSARLMPTSVARTPRGSRRLNRPPSCLERFGLLPWWDVLPLRPAAVPPAAAGGSPPPPPPPPPPTSGSPSRARLRAKARFNFICGPPREPELCDDGSVLVSDTTLAVSSEPPPPAGSPAAAKSASEPVSVHDLRCGGALRRWLALAAGAAGVWRRKEPSPKDVDMSLLDGVLAGVVRCVLGGEQGGLGRLPVDPSRFRAAAMTVVDVGAACCGAGFLALFALLSADGTKTSSGARSEGGVGRRRFGRPKSTDDPPWLLGLEPPAPSPSGLTLWY